MEIRNEEFLTPMYFAVLREHEVAHVFNSWTRMPAIGDQLDLPGSVSAPFIVAVQSTASGLISAIEEEGYTATPK